MSARKLLRNVYLCIQYLSFMLNECGSCVNNYDRNGITKYFIATTYYKGLEVIKSNMKKFKENRMSL